MDYIDFAINLAYVLIGVGMWKLGKQDPRGFLYQAGGAFIFMICGFFMKDGGTPIMVWNIIFGLIGIAGYRRLRDQ